ncbi:hypothetical protein ACP4OV_028459 [Aristida adscensionis]
MPHRRDGGEEEEAPSPRPSGGAGCYAFLARSASASSRRARAGGYRRLESSGGGGGAAAMAAKEVEAAVRVEVGTGGRGKGRSVFHVDPAVLEAGPVRLLLAAAGARRLAGGAVAVAVDALLFEHLLWLATTKAEMAGGEAGARDDSAAAADLSEIVEFYSHDDDDEL